MVKLQRRPIGEPDDVREVPNGRLETYDLGEIRIGRSILQPGWRWSESIKPIARTAELLAGSPIGFTDRGLHALKGLAEERRVYQVEPVGPGATTADT